MTAELITHQSMGGQWTFRFQASDGRTVASGDGYATLDDMRHGVEEAAAVLRLTKDLERQAAWGLGMR